MADIQIVEGDIFRWSYKDEKPGERGDYRRYHCRSCFAVARKEILVDTYWGSAVSDNERWTFEDAVEELDLTKLGNLADLEKVPEYKAVYYDDADCVDLNHGNSSKGNFYIRKGAQRSRAKMIAEAAKHIANSESDLASAQERLARYQGILSDLLADKPLDGVFL